MVVSDTLGDALSHILSYEKIGRKEVILNKSSKMINKVLDVLKENNYVGSYDVIEDGRGKKIKLNLLNNINKCGVIKPRHKVKIAEFEKFEKRYLPAKGFGILIVTTSKGLMTNDAAKEKKVGGKLVAYCY
jgi:small subunit ribosomal protein S8